MPQIPRELTLDYLREYKFGGTPTSQRRKVPFRTGKPDALEERVQFFNFDSFCWKHARRLEGREHVADSEGIWPINCWRCERRFGIPGHDIFPSEMTLNETPAFIFQAAREMRRFCYFRVANADDAKRLIAVGRDVRYATEITSDWYDPPQGYVQAVAESPVIHGAHAVPLVEIERSNGEFFKFPNSWGEEWGDGGWGRISTEHFDRFLIEGWIGVGLGLYAPIGSTQGIICIEWKWSLNDDISIHGREVIDADNDERIAWAFCKRREGYLDVEEFFVWPSERGKGYGRQLAKMITSLASTLGLPLRMLVSYADTEPGNRENLAAAARLLELELTESDERWVHMIGTKSPIKTNRPFPRPQRPAFMLERLRPKDEKPVDSPIQYSVIFGTNRQPLDPKNLGAGFVSDRGNALQTGVATVTIPRTHRFGSKGSTWLKIWNRITGKYPRISGELQITDETALAAEIGRLLAAFPDEKQNLLYVHGFNVSFEAAIVQAAHFGVDLKVPGATFAYSWPSAARIDRYLADEAAIEASLPYFEEYLHLILQQTGTVPLNIIVHSMGNRAVLRFLDAISRDASATARGRIRNVIFAAPDVDTDVFKAAARQIVGFPSRLTLYATRADLALQASEWLHSFARAGLAPPVVTVPGMDSVLVENFDLLNLGHGYYAEASALLHDMFVLLHYDADPSSRPALVAAETMAGEQFWKLAQ